MSEHATTADDASLALPLRATVSPRPSSRIWSAVQRALGLLACIALTPLFLVVYPLVCLTSPGPFFFRQERPGYRSQRFTMLKVRTMRPGSEKKNALGTAQGDPSITPVGHVLRKFKIDELPQLWNVARGDMELVGPRPIPIALDDALRARIEDFHLRYEVKPGLTNVSQVAVLDNALGDKLVEDWGLRFEGELHYIRNKSFAYDVVVIALTLAFVLRKLVVSRRAPQDAK